LSDPVDIMKIELKKFGALLMSRPAGREAFLVVKSYLSPQSADETIDIDFTDVDVVAPSWLDEFLTHLRAEFGDRVVCLPSDNPTVIESLKAIES
jgi:hypothetical protein